MYGHHTLTQTFSIGDSVIAVASTKAHKTQIYVNGKLKYDWAISSGKPGDDTPNGSYLTIEKANPVRMIGPGYDLSVPWSVRFTFSGDYYHDAYWSVGEQGFENVSHGCVNLAPANAETYYNLAVPGDPITISGSPRAGAWDNGWTEWFLTWPQYLKGCATGTRRWWPARRERRSSTRRRCRRTRRRRRCRPPRRTTASSRGPRTGSLAGNAGGICCWVFRTAGNQDAEEIHDRRVVQRRRIAPSAQYGRGSPRSHL